MLKSHMMVDRCDCQLIIYDAHPAQEHLLQFRGFRKTLTMRWRGGHALTETGFTTSLSNDGTSGAKPAA